MTLTAMAPTGSSSIQADLWGKHARDYAEIIEPNFLPLYKSVMARPEMAKIGSVLDIGCGPGLAAQTFSTRIARVAGADATAPFIEIASRRTPRGDFRVAEMETLPFGDDSFDAATGFNSFQYAASSVNALCEAKRIVKDGGVIVIAVWGAPEDCEASGHLAALGSLLPPPPPGTAGPCALSDDGKLRALAGEAGLTPGAIVDVPCPWEFADLETALRGMLSAGPAERAIRASSLERAREAIAASIEPYRTASGGYHLNNSFRYLVTSA